MKRTMKRSICGSAMIETALLLPLYMLILFGLLYFGYETLHRQRAAKAAAFAAWMPDVQSAELLESRVWSATGPVQDMTLTVNGDTSEAGDMYWRKDIQPTSTISGVISGADAVNDPMNTFNPERVALHMWRIGQGRVSQRFVFGQGVVTQQNPTSLSTRINQFLDTSYPRIDDTHGVINNITRALNGTGTANWIERRHAELAMDYTPPWLPSVFEDPNSSGTTYEQLYSGQYPPPSEKLTSNAAMAITGRSALGARLAAGDRAGGDPNGQLINDVAGLFHQAALSPANDMDNTPAAVAPDGTTLKVPDLYKRDVLDRAPAAN